MTIASIARRRSESETSGSAPGARTESGVVWRRPEGAVEGKLSSVHGDDSDSLLRISELLLGEEDVATLTARITEAIRELVDADGCAIVHATGAAEVSRWSSDGAGEARGPDRMSRITESFAPAEILALVASGAPFATLHVEDATADHRLAGLRASRGPLLPVRGSLLAVSLPGSAGSANGFVVWHREEGAFSARNARMLASVAKQVGLAFARAERWAKLDSAVRGKDELLAQVCHELRQPVGCILGWGQLLSRQKSSADEIVDQGMRIIAKNATTLSHLIDDILHDSCLRRNRLSIRPELIDVHETLDWVVGSARVLAASKGIDLVLRADGELGSMLADEERVAEVLRNFLSNAVKFTPAGGRVEVHAHRSEKDLSIVVRDTGEGIEASELPFVFDRYWRSSATSAGARDGLGLGLSIARQLVELHGGSVHVSSAGRGHGASFEVRLPLFGRPVPPKEPRRESETAAPRPPFCLPLLGTRIVVLDDDEDLRDLFGMILQRAGANVIQTGTIAEAMQSIEEFPPDIVLSDISLSGEDGLDFARRVSSHPREDVRSVPVVALTGHRGSAVGEEIIAAGFQVHAYKPIDAQQLVSLVGRFTSRLGGPAKS